MVIKKPKNPFQDTGMSIDPNKVNKPDPTVPSSTNPIYRANVQTTDTGVKYTTGGQTFDLSTEENNLLNQAMSGKTAIDQLPNKVSAVYNFVNSQKQKAAIARDLNAGAQTQNLTNQLMQQEAIRQGIPETKIPSLEELAPKREDGFLKKAGSKLLDVAFPTTEENPLHPLAYQLPILAEAVDSIGNFLPFGIGGLGESTKVKMAKDDLRDLNTAITNNIKAVEMGADPSDTLQNIELAIEKINTLEAQTHGTGRLKLRYWLDEGRSLEVEAIKQKEILEQKRVELQQAIIKAQQAQVMANFGQPI